MTATIDIYGYPAGTSLAARWQQAMVSAQSGNPTGAARKMQEILAEQPDFVPAMLQAAYLLLATGRYRDARTLALQAGESMPASPELVLEIVKLLRRFEAIEAIERIVSDHDWSACSAASLLVQLAAQVAPVGLYAQASALLDRAVAIESDMPAIATLQGTIHSVHGNKPAARAAYRRALASSKSPLPHVHWLMSLVSEGDAEDAILAIEGARAQVTPGGEGEAYLSFALHNVCHAAGLHDASWRALARGCGIKQQLEPHNHDRQQALFRLLHDVDPRNDSEPAISTAGGPRLIFIVGMHRSGTTLLERMLSGQGDIADGGESRVFSAALMQTADHFTHEVLDAELVQRLARKDLSEAGEAFRRYARWRAAGRRWLTEKLPSNFLNLGFILRALPEARILHMRRDPVDTCFSNLRTFFSGAAAYSYDQGELADFYRQYQALMRHWHERAPGSILDVDYAALVGEPELQARRIAAFCGVDYVPEMLQVDRAGGAVATASIGSVRAGILKDRGDAWKPYAEQLQPLLDALQTADNDPANP